MFPQPSEIESVIIIPTSADEGVEPQMDQMTVQGHTSARLGIALCSKSGPSISYSLKVGFLHAFLSPLYILHINWHFFYSGSSY